MVKVGQKIVIHYGNRFTEVRRVTKVFANGRIQIKGKAPNWYEEEPGLYRVWNDPGYTSMIATVEN